MTWQLKWNCLSQIFHIKGSQHICAACGLPHLNCLVPMSLEKLPCHYLAYGCHKSLQATWTQSQVIAKARWQNGSEEMKLRDDWKGRSRCDYYVIANDFIDMTIHWIHSLKDSLPLFSALQHGLWVIHTLVCLSSCVTDWRVLLTLNLRVKQYKCLDCMNVNIRLLVVYGVVVCTVSSLHRKGQSRFLY